ncbi:hypothetical protein BX616_009463 [Lobosporangium transversale]|uniref:UreD urease accessory protein-domain-containing protein n=1 Tax=Lobosporangium transversale TaxID=64571 RepID=A0A1Y2GFS0_9FUNG|nr:UreD urease accessory protein-domain-containing protein [Lobosporangium transversale]KAF9913847.1 hypothetical protein BX616_009463 [Lobosporangium transversale]ORZ09650.1 UreD urease accessory protein-domain-containing protein [Lobosporangium transversale]|eukprot:XP_021878920.1 UreD urease accessory protein-domain-containing protein [Lobosporangium transversale]
MAFQPPSAHLPTRVVATGSTTTAVVSQNFLRAAARSKYSLTQIDSLRASYPLKLLSPASANTIFLKPEGATSPLTPSFSVSNSRDSEDKNQSSISPFTLNSSSPPSSNSFVLVPPPPRIVYMITYGGGLLADDHPNLQFVLQRHAKLLVLGQGNTKIYKSPKPDYPPASQTLHSTVAPGACLLFLGPAVVACEDSSVFLRHEILLQAQRPRDSTKIKQDPEKEWDEDDELPSCVVLDWIAGGRGENERWKARRAEWRLIVRWAELDPEATPTPPPSSTTNIQTTGSSSSKGRQKMVGKEEKDNNSEEDEFVDEEDPRDIADRLAGGPVIFRDGFLIEHNPPLPSKKATPIATPSLIPSMMASGLKPKMTSYAPSLYPHSTIGSLFIMGPKTRRLQRSILKRFDQLTVYPGQKPEQRADYPILWSVTVVQVPRPPCPNQGGPISTTIPKRKHLKMNAMVVKMASQGIEQMQDFLKSLFEEEAGVLDNRKKMMDSSDDDNDDGNETNHQKAQSRRAATVKESICQEKLQDEYQRDLSVIDELFGGRTVWERVFR